MPPSRRPIRIKRASLPPSPGGSSARCKLAFDLAVDPNTSFPPLSDQLKRLATASAFGETSANVGLSFVASPAAIAISVAARATRYVRRSAMRLRRSLRRMGARRSPRWAFREPPSTPSTHAMLAPHRQGDYRRSAAKFRRRERPAPRCATSTPAGGADCGLQQAGGASAQLPAACWRAHATNFEGHGEPLARGLSNLDAAAGRACCGCQSRSRRQRTCGFWIRGRASRAATAKLEELGWKEMPKAGVPFGQ